jgi:hypothetical protein
VPGRSGAVNTQFQFPIYPQWVGTPLGFGCALDEHVSGLNLLAQPVYLRRQSFSLAVIASNARLASSPPAGSAIG